MNNIDHSEYFHLMRVVQHAPPDPVIVEIPGNIQIFHIVHIVKAIISCLEQSFRNIYLSADLANINSDGGDRLI